MRDALARLPSSDRELLVLRHAEQMSMTEMAAVLGVTEAAVKSRHFRALQQLRNALGENTLGGSR